MVSISEDGKQMELLSTASGRLNWLQPIWKTIWQYLLMLSIYLPEDYRVKLLAIKLTGISVYVNQKTCTRK